MHEKEGEEAFQVHPLEDEGEVWMNEEKLTATDLLAIQQAKRKLETLDAEFRGRYVAAVDELENDEELEHKQVILNDDDLHNRPPRSSD